MTNMYQQVAQLNGSSRLGSASRIILIIDRALLFTSAYILIRLRFKIQDKFYIPNCLVSKIQALLALMISTNSGLREAPPTKNPSTSCSLANSLQFLALTLPP